jgi:hypothetical protein
VSALARLLLLCGTVAGPLFTAAWLLGGAGREGYSALRHPISSLAIGDAGWMQTATFLVTGLLVIAFAVGGRLALGDRGPSRWTSIFLAAVGFGLVGAGWFVTDPMNGYPPGTPLVPTDFTVAGRLHRAFSALVFLGMPLAAFSAARWLAVQGATGWARYSRVTAWAFLAAFAVTTIGFLGLGGLDRIAGLLQRITLTIGWVWVTLLAIRIVTWTARESDSAASSSDGAA